ncbi:MAG TPA: cell division protein FtsQ/DivIB [Caulobacteraceae bacterium]|jgi:cell division protein FtsQ|nr:cell division protein FtsQ/DivIB [Caulobacteraceae bacterium]
MPAVMRGGNGNRKPKGAGRGGRAKGPAAYAPAKLRGAAGVGLPPQVAVSAACGVFVAGLILLLATGGRGEALVGAVGHGLDNRMGAMGFRVATVQVRGASAFSEPYIRQAVGLAPGGPILGLDLEGLRTRAESVGWVRSATVARLLPDTVVVTVSERPRLAVWQSGGVTRVVDPEGHVIPEADPGLFSDLPLVVGQGAAEAAAAILPLVQTRPALTKRMEALVRVDGRRWDIRLKDGGLIQLPATGEDAALIQLDQLDQRSRLLELGFARIDLRDPQMIAVRPRARSEDAGV